MSDSAHPMHKWIDAWLHSDLIGVPITLAAAGIAAISFGLFIVIGEGVGLFVGALLFILALGGLVGLIALLEGRRGETTEALAIAAPGDRHDRILVVANEALDSPTLSREVQARRSHGAVETMIVAPVVATSAMHALANDVDHELHEAQDRVDDAVDALRAVGVTASGHVDVGEPMRCLIDGLREFPATEVLLIEGDEHGWKDAERFAERVRAEVSLPVWEISAREAVS